MTTIPEIDHAAADIITRLTQVTPQAAEVAGRVLQIQAITSIVACIAILIFCIMLFAWAFRNFALADEKNPLTFVLMFFSGIFGVAVVIIGLSDVAAALSPKLALAARVMEALPR